MNPMNYVVITMPENVKFQMLKLPFSFLWEMKGIIKTLKLNILIKLLVIQLERFVAPFRTYD